MSEHYTRATVEWIRAPRIGSEFVANVGLGLSGFGWAERFEITYSPGEKVDEARVLQAVNGMIRSMDESRDEYKISCPRVIRIRQNHE